VIKYIIAVFFFLLPHWTNAQYKEFTEVDRYAANVGYYRADTLAGLLTKPYNTERQKVRSIFYWIAQHIAYDVPKARGDRHYYFSYRTKLDSINQRREMINKIVAGHKGICEDYSRLFCLLCEYAGIRAEMVTGYARSGVEIAGDDRKPEHAWNAVLIDKRWHLLDVTWAAGYVTRRDAFVPHYNNYYFLTPPEHMKLNHLPEDDKWLLCKNNCSLDEFYNYPLIYFDMSEYGNRINSFLPKKGVFNVSMGSTVKFAFDVEDTTKMLEVVGYPYEGTHPNYGSSYLDHSSAGPARPAAAATTGSTGRNRIQVVNNIDDNYTLMMRNKKKTPEAEDEYIASPTRVVRRYEINNPIIEELHVYYGDELMLRYIVNITK